LGSTLYNPLGDEAWATWTFLPLPLVAMEYQLSSDSWKMAGSGKLLLMTGSMFVVYSWRRWTRAPETSPACMMVPREKIAERA
jgi:hypothetical protein